MLMLGLCRTCLALAPSDLPAPAISSGKIGWVGLGTMGKHMAMHIHQNNKDDSPLCVWNRTPERADEHAAMYGTRKVESLAQLSQECCVVFLSLPTTNEVAQVVEELSELVPGSVIVDTTSGEPGRTKELADNLEERGVYYMDCPVSGGPAGAEAGTLTCMLGGNDNLVQAVQPLLAFAGKTFHCGPIGSGMACKSINNILNTAHLLVGAEGLLMLKKLGVDPDIALSVINASSGRSLQTEARLPEDVLTGRFGYGFKLPLMAKDCRIAASIAEQQFPGATLLPEVSRLMNEAEKSFPEGDYTEAVRLLEEQAGVDLRTNERE